MSQIEDDFNSEQAFAMSVYTPSVGGSITLGSGADISAELSFAQDFAWNIFSEMVFLHDFKWNIGSNALYYYRIEGDCASGDCDPTGTPLDACDCCRFIEYVAAKDLSDLCAKLKERNLNLPITRPISSIKKSSLPVYTTDIDANIAAGIDQSCSTLEDQSYCHIPECIDFCLVTFGNVKMGMSVTIQENFFSHNASGSLLLSGHASATGGSLGYGVISLSGSALVSSSFYDGITGSGGLIAGTFGLVTFDDWHYTPPIGYITLSGGSEWSSTDFTYTPSGGITLSGSGLSRIILRYIVGDPKTIYVGDGADIDTSDIDWIATSDSVGDFSLEFSNAFDIIPAAAHIISGGFVTGGQVNPTSTQWTAVVSGSLTTGNQALITFDDWHYSGSGGITISSTSAYKFKLSGSGGLSLSGIANFVIRPIVSGTLYVGSYASPITFDDWHWTGSGSIVVGDSANVFNGNIGLLDVKMGIDVSLSLIEAYLSSAETVDNSTLTISNGEIDSNCGCTNIPLIIRMNHNLLNDNALSFFLKRNNFNIPTMIGLKYNAFDSTWRSNYNFVGSSGNNGREQWNIIFEWGCTNSIGGTTLDNYVWRFSTYINRRDYLTGQDDETRILYTFTPDPACIDDSLNFSFDINTKDGSISTIRPSTVETAIFYDYIGLFKNKYWTSKPKLSINIKEFVSSSTEKEINIAPFFPERALIFNSE